MGNAAKELSLTFRAEPSSVPRARRALREFAAAAGATVDQVDAVRLASSEAVTNAVLHAYRDEPGRSTSPRRSCQTSCGSWSPTTAAGWSRGPIVPASASGSD